MPSQPAPIPHSHHAIVELHTRACIVLHQFFKCITTAALTNAKASPSHTNCSIAGTCMLYASSTHTDTIVVSWIATPVRVNSLACFIHPFLPSHPHTLALHRMYNTIRQRRQ